MTTQVIVNALIFALAIATRAAVLLAALCVEILSDLRSEMRESGRMRLYVKALQSRLPDADRDAAIAEVNAAQQGEVRP